MVRVGVGPQTLATPLVPPATRPLDELEPMTAGALRRFLDAYSVVPDLPVALSLRGFARVFVGATCRPRGADRSRTPGTARRWSARCSPSSRSSTPPTTC